MAYSLPQEWLTPQQALATFSKGDIVLPPPTWVTINQLVANPTLATLQQACTEKAHKAAPTWLPVQAAELGGMYWLCWLGAKSRPPQALTIQPLSYLCPMPCSHPEKAPVAHRYPNISQKHQVKMRGL